MQPSVPLARVLLLLCGCLVAADGHRAAGTEPDAAPAVFGIGSPAPSIDVSDWIHAGTARPVPPLTHFAPGTIYVLEFWATWCEHSREAVPLLARLQRKYGRDVVVIAIALDQPEELRGFLADPDIDVRELAVQAGTYCLVVDADCSVEESYMDPILESGLPTAFVVGRQGRIEWIGHPQELEEPLDRIVAGSWDRDAFAAAWTQAQRPRRLVDRAIDLMADGKPDEAAATLGQLAADEGASAALLNDLAWKVAERSVFSPLPDVVLAAAEQAATRSVALDPDDGNFLDTLARIQALRGRLDMAIATQRRAVERGGGDDDGREFRDFLRHLESRKR